MTADGESEVLYAVEEILKEELQSTTIFSRVDGHNCQYLKMAIKHNRYDRHRIRFYVRATPRFLLVYTEIYRSCGKRFNPSSLTPPRQFVTADPDCFRQIREFIRQRKSRV